MIIYSNKAKSIPLHEFDTFEAYRSQDTLRKMAYWSRCCQEQITAQHKQIQELTRMVNELQQHITDDSK
jgi:hypothetical protein